MALGLMLSASGAVSAQVSGSVSLVSNYVYRGISLSDGKPEAQLNLNADFDSGWFAGAFASPVDLPSTHAQAVGYGGYASQLTADISWEAGLSETVYSGALNQNYSEVFVGLSSDRLNGRIYYSPNYLGQSVHSVYGELNFNQPLTGTLRFTAHAGYLSVQGGNSESTVSSHGDTRLGLAYHVGDWNLQWAVASIRETTLSYSPYQDVYRQQVSQHYSGVLDASWNF